MGSGIKDSYILVAAFAPALKKHAKEENTV